MIVLAILSTLGAIALTLLVLFGNSMNPAPTADNFMFGWVIWLGWIACALLWVSWAVDRWLA
jgi:hypothetical protein